MYWITGYGYTATLEEGNLDGSGLKTVLAKGEISYPESLFWDVAAQKYGLFLLHEYNKF